MPKKSSGGPFMAFVRFAADATPGFMSYQLP